MSESPLGALGQLTKILYEWGTRTPLGALAQDAGENVAGSLGRMKEAALAPGEESLGPTGAIPSLVAGLQRWQSRGRGAPVTGLPIDRPPTREEAAAHGASVEGSATPINKMLYSVGLAGGSPAEAVGSLGSLFLGGGARHAPLDRLFKAQQMSQLGHSAEDVYFSTRGKAGEPGVSYGKEGQPRWEISDRDATINESKFSPLQGKGDIQIFAGNLGDVYAHDELVKNYPGILDRKIGIAYGPGLGKSGSFNPATGQLEVFGANINEAISALTHELQHVVQAKEGFAAGASDEIMKGRVLQKLSPSIKRMDDLYEAFLKRPAKGKTEEDLFNTPTFMGMLRKNLDLEDVVKDKGGNLFEVYKRVAGEVEARNAEIRRLMTLQERAQFFPRATADRPWDKQILIPAEEIYGGYERRRP